MQYPNWHFAYAPCEPAGAQPPQSAPDEAALSQILAKRSIRTVFQPIVSLETGRVLGYEALSRGPAGTTYEQPALLFEAARQTGHLWELDSLCRLQALECLAHRRPAHFQHRGEVALGWQPLIGHKLPERDRGHDSLGNPLAGSLERDRGQVLGHGGITSPA